MILGCTHSRPKNVVLVIVDGMGPEQVHAGRIFNGNQKLVFEEFPYQNTVTTHNIDGDVTDSAAAGTAIATGHKVKNKVISPGKTMLERFKEQGKSVGIITNTLVTDATPAAFAAHAETRKDTLDIFGDYAHQTQPNFMGGADEKHYIDELKKSNLPYRIAKSRSELGNLKGAEYAYAGFGVHQLVPNKFGLSNTLPLAITDSSYYTAHDIPTLSEIARAGLEVLSQNKNGFFLMVESGLVDRIGHKNRDMDSTPSSPQAIDALGYEMNETNRLVTILRDFAEANPETLIVLTADHETGGLKIDESKTACLGQKGCIPNATWTSDTFVEPGIGVMAKHTGVNVGVYAMGPGAAAFARPMDNTQFFNKIVTE